MPKQQNKFGAKKLAMKQSKRDREKVKAIAKADALKPIGGKCPECKLRIRTNDMGKHRAGISHIRRVGVSTDRTKYGGGHK